MGKEVATGSDDELVRQVAEDIAAAVVHHIKTMYPSAVEAAPSSMLLSVRGCVINQVIAATKTHDAMDIVARLERNKAHRRKIDWLRREAQKARPGGPKVANGGA